MRYVPEKKFAIELVQEVGKIMAANLHIGHAFTLKDDNTHVTEVDKQINRRIIEAIRTRFPGDSILGEEESYIRKTDTRLWICDPLDGTFPFKCGIPISMVLLSLTEGGIPKLAVAYNPYIKQLFVATEGGGAFVNNKRVFVNKDFAELTTHTPIGLTGPNPSTVLDAVSVWNKVNESGARMQLLGVTGYEHMLVGCGQFGGQIFGGITRHDIVVGDLFVREAGGMATDVYGKPLRYDHRGEPPQGAILSNGTLHQSLLEIVTPYVYTTADQDKSYI